MTKPEPNLPAYGLTPSQTTVGSTRVLNETIGGLGTELALPRTHTKMLVMMVGTTGQRTKGMLPGERRITVNAGF